MELKLKQLFEKGIAVSAKAKLNYYFIVNVNLIYGGSTTKLVYKPAIFFFAIFSSKPKTPAYFWMIFENIVDCWVDEIEVKNNAILLPLVLTKKFSS